MYCVEHAPSHFVLQLVVSTIPVQPHGFVTVLSTIQSGVRHELEGQLGPSVLVIVTQETGLVVMVERVLDVVRVEQGRRLVS